MYCRAATLPKRTAGSRIAIRAAEPQYLKAGDIFRSILLNEEDPNVKQLQALDLQMQVALFINAKKHHIAKEYLAIIGDYYENLYKIDPKKSANWQGALEIRSLNGLLQESMNNYGMAAKSYESVFSILQKHIDSDPENLLYQARANLAYTQLGCIYLLAGEYEKSKEAFEKPCP